MLDGVALDHKLSIARIWFERARAGQFTLTGREAENFLQLLKDCEHEALVNATQAHIDAARIVLLDGELEMLGRKVPVLRPFDLPPNVADLAVARRARAERSSGGGQ